MPERKKKRREFEYDILNALRCYGLEPDRHDKTIKGLRYRPDFVFFRNDLTILIEVDEYGHATYDQQKERKRVEAISKEFRGRLAFIRVYVPCADDTIERLMELLECDCTREVKDEKIQVMRFVNGVQE